MEDTFDFETNAKMIDAAARESRLPPPRPLLTTKLARADLGFQRCLRDNINKGTIELTKVDITSRGDSEPYYCVKFLGQDADHTEMQVMDRFKTLQRATKRFCNLFEAELQPLTLCNIITHALPNGSPIKPGDDSFYFSVTHKTLEKQLDGLCENVAKHRQ